MKDYVEVEKVLNNYIEGAKKGNSNIMKATIHESATMYGHFNGVGLMEGSIDQLYEFTDSTGPAENLQARIDILDLTKTSATARILIKDWNGLDFIDYMNLLKIDGEWKLINKTFHQHSS